MVNDPSKAYLKGDGIGLMKCGKQMSFVLTTPGATMNDTSVKINGKLSTCYLYLIISSVNRVFDSTKDLSSQRHVFISNLGVASCVYNEWK